MAALTVLGACQSMDDIDRKINRTVAHRSDRLDGNSLAPVRTFRDPKTVEAGDAYDRTPHSINPPADDLLFNEAPDLEPNERLNLLDEYLAPPADARVFTLEDAFEQSKSSREYLAAEEEYILSSIRLLIQRHLFSPRFFNDLIATIDAFPTDPEGGDYRVALDVVNNLRVNQRLPYGGELEAALITRASDQLRNAVTDSYQQSSSLVLSADIPLLRGAGPIASEDLIQAERDLVYSARTFERFRRRFFRDIAANYFDLLLQRQNIENQRRSLESIQQGLERTQARVKAGREAAFQARNFEQTVLSSQDSLIRAQEQYRLGLDRFKIRLGLPVSTELQLQEVNLELPEPGITPSQAADLALVYRLDLQNRRDQIEDARRGVLNARNQLLPDLDIGASVAFNTPRDLRIGRFRFNSDETTLSATAVLSLPLDREIERLNLRSATIALERAIRDLDEFIDQIILDARQSVRDLVRFQFLIQLQDRTVRINELRLEEIRLKEDEVETLDRLDAENALLNARNARDGAVRDYRVAVLDYLLTTGQLRIGSDGSFIPLQGMLISRGDPQPATRGPRGEQDIAPPVGEEADDSDEFVPPPPPEGEGVREPGEEPDPVPGRAPGPEPADPEYASRTSTQPEENRETKTGLPRRSR